MCVGVLCCDCVCMFVLIVMYFICCVVECGYDVLCFGDFVEVMFCFFVVFSRARRETSRRRDVLLSDVCGCEW